MPLSVCDHDLLWSDLKTHKTYLLGVGDLPHESIKGLVGGWPQVEVPHQGLDDSWVSLGQPLTHCLLLKLVNYILS